MSKYQTIQKVTEELGVEASLIHSLIKNNEIGKFKLKGRRRILIDREEIDALIIPINEVVDFNFDDFKV